jgi:hypothetical protein
MTGIVDSGGGTTRRAVDSSAIAGPRFNDQAAGSLRPLACQAKPATIIVVERFAAFDLFGGHFDNSGFERKPENSIAGRSQHRAAACRTCPAALLDHADLEAAGATAQPQAGRHLGDALVAAGDGQGRPAGQ